MLTFSGGLCGFILVLSFAFTAQAQRAHPCPGPDWVARRGTSYCYFLKTTKFTSDKWFWEDARQACRVRGGELAYFQDENELDFLESIVKTSVDTAYWIGLTYESGDWKWTDTNQTFTPSSFPSYPLPPFDDWPSNATRPQYRGYLEWRAEKWRFGTDRDGRKAFVCKATFANRPLCKTDEGWEFIHDRCWRFEAVYHTWGKASQVCRASGSTIAVPQSLEENKMLVQWSNIALNMKLVWIGLQINKLTTPLDLNSVYFENGQLLLEANFTYFNEPNVSKTIAGLREGTYHAYLDDTYTSNLGKWKFDGSVAGTKPYACETTREKCPYGWDHLDDDCYRLFESDDDIRTWEEGAQFCAQQGGHLAVVTSQRVQDFLTARLAEGERSDDGQRYYWLGYRAEKGTHWSWTPHSMANTTNTGYTHWMGGTVPASTALQDRCAFIDSQSTTGRWQDAPCTDNIGFICQANYRAALQEEVVHMDFDCAPPFEKYFEGCYLTVSTPTDWNNAKEYCLDQRSTLVVIHSAGENAFIKDRVSGDAWIGIRRTDLGGGTQHKPNIVLQYSDGSNMSTQAFRNFEERDPTSVFEITKMCYYLSSPLSGWSFTPGQWKPDVCGYAKPFVCYHRGTPLPAREPQVLDSEECGLGWIPNNNSCYKIHFEHVQELQASQTCQRETSESSLLYITSREEQRFIRDMINGRSNYTHAQLAGSGSFWIGLRVVNSSFTWYWQYRDSFNQWTLPLSFSNWNSNEPKVVSLRATQPGYTYMRADEDAKWATAPGTERRPFICKKPARNGDGIVTTDLPWLPFNVTYGCPAGWNLNDGHCYRYANVSLSWPDALLDCQTTDNAALASFGSELQFETATLANHWIGLNCLKSPENPRVYENSDGTPVTYTPWAGPQLANNTDGKACVFASGETVRLANCSEQRPYVCIAPVLQTGRRPAEGTTQVPDTGCQTGGHGHGGSCYYMGYMDDGSSSSGTHPFLTFSGARRLCQQDYKGDLVVLNDEEERIFVTGLLTSWAADAWIGLKEVDNEWSSFSKWVDGELVTVTHWGEGEPRALQRATGCVALQSVRTADRLPGDWYIAGCEDYKFAMCESPREGWTTSPPPTTAAPVGCPRNWNAAPAPSKYCYKAYCAADSDCFRASRTWQDAENFCQAYQGHLASIKSEGEQAAVRSAVRAESRSTDQEYWLGLNESPNLAVGSLIPRWEWADGTPFGTVSFFHPTIDHSSNALLHYDCVVIEAETGQWIKQSCHLVTGWVCEVPRGLYSEGEELNVVLPEPATIRTNTTCAKGVQASGRWHYDTLTDNCFFLSSTEEIWDDAQARCLAMSANLATVSQLERVFVTTLLSERIPEDSQIYIGLRLADYVTKKHEWVDGSLSTYRLWDKGQPHPTGLEACVTVNSRNGKWMDEYCSKKYRYLCLADKDASPEPEPVLPEGGCPTGMKEFGRFCYFISPTAERLTWERARAACIRKDPSAKSNLLSIHSSLENSFIVSELGTDRVDRWVGLHEDDERESFYWSDNTIVNYEAWNWNEPFNKSEPQCVKISGEAGHAGRWNDELCRVQNGYICKSRKSLLLPTAAPVTGNCSSGYQPYGEACFAVRSQVGSNQRVPMTIIEAKAQCDLDGGSIATISSIYENAFIHTLLAGKTGEAWIGLEKQGGNVAWGSGCPLAYTGHLGADESIGSACTTISPVDGTWSLIPCDATQSFVICEKRTVPCLTLPATITGQCPPGYSSTCSEFCYSIEQSTATVQGAQLTFEEARDACQRNMGTLAAIRTSVENTCIAELISHSNAPLWIGLFELRKVGSTTHMWTWVNESVNLAYSNWISSTGSSTGTRPSRCGQINVNGRWMPVQCESTAGYICEAPRVATPTTISLATDTVATSTKPTVTTSSEESTPSTMGSTPASTVSIGTTDNSAVFSTSAVILTTSLTTLRADTTILAGTTGTEAVSSQTSSTNIALRNTSVMPPRVTILPLDQNGRLTTNSPLSSSDPNAGTLVGVALTILIIVPGLTYLAFFLWRKRSGPSGRSSREITYRKDIDLDRQPVVDFTQEESYT